MTGEGGNDYYAVRRGVSFAAFWYTSLISMAETKRSVLYFCGSQFHNSVNYNVVTLLNSSWHLFLKQQEVKYL